MLQRRQHFSRSWLLMLQEEEGRSHRGEEVGMRQRMMMISTACFSCWEHNHLRGSACFCVPGLGPGINSVQAADATQLNVDGWWGGGGQDVCGSQVGVVVGSDTVKGLTDCTTSNWSVCAVQQLIGLFCCAYLIWRFHSRQAGFVYQLLLCRCARVAFILFVSRPGCDKSELCQSTSAC